MKSLKTKHAEEMKEFKKKKDKDQEKKNSKEIEHLKTLHNYEIILVNLKIKYQYLRKN